MAELLDELNKYVPIKQSTEIVELNGKSFNVDRLYFHDAYYLETS